LKQVREDEGYNIILPGHGKPADKSAFDNILIYLDKSTEIRSKTNTPEE
jgi:hypothetical protein